MAAASFALQKAIYAALTADAAVVAALGGPRIYDDVPVRSDFPYLTFGQSTERDWSTATDDGHEHLVTLHVWSRARGRKETDEVMAAAQGSKAELHLHRHPQSARSRHPRTSSSIGVRLLSRIADWGASVRLPKAQEMLCVSDALTLDPQPSTPLARCSAEDDGGDVAAAPLRLRDVNVRVGNQEDQRPVIT